MALVFSFSPSTVVPLVFLTVERLIAIIVDVNCPERVLDSIPASILRRSTEEEKEMIKGSADFYAIGNVFR